jgi:hypothetical protein
MYDYDKLFSFVCEKLYYVKLKDGYEYRGLLMNYYGGNIVMFTENGIVHEQYKNIETMRPTRKVSDKFQEILKGAIKNETD